MGESKTLKAALASLPAGLRIRFHPSEEQLFSYYLSNKNNTTPVPCSSVTDNSLFGFDLIEEIDMSNYHPCDLPEITCFPFAQSGSKKSSYFFTAKVPSWRGKREAQGGYWKSEGLARAVVGGEEASLLGTRETFAFYEGDLSCAMKTDWFMYEYAPVCLQQGNKKSVHVLSSYAVETDAAMHDVGIQHDGATIFGTGGAIMHDGKPVDADNKIARSPMKLIIDPNDPYVAGPVSADGLQLPVDIPQPGELVRQFNGIISGSTISDDAVADELMINFSMLKEAFIELDDLVCPLSGFDFSG
ncbi:hypothetical protein HHK36_002609 [Tetracentron sinense]|uniref:NAC domain-containing protein n=1 Tax=Tetracentron sinense TaxID=13715 RepID=A0A835DRR6_TETSI|nr:hypothetical protein HHK36_002609 [Tetracentron sinense]